MRFSKHWKDFARVFQTLEKRLVLLSPLAVLLFAHPVTAQDSLLSARERTHLMRALARLDMTEADLAFEKDVARPEWVNERNRRFLHEPLLLPEYGADWLRAATNGVDALWEESARALETHFQAVADPPWDNAAVARALDGFDPVLRDALAEFLRAMVRARAGTEAAFADLSRAEKEYALASHLWDFFRVEDFPAREADMTNARISSAIVEKVRREGEDIYPEPEVGAYLAILRKARLPFLMAAARHLHEATIKLAARARDVASWPGRVTRVATPAGAIVIGTTGADVFSEPVALILDPGGDDYYEGEVGAANELAGRSVSVVVDLGGADRYHSDAMSGAGTALFGVSLIYDERGDDVYESEGMGQGAALFGVAWVDDADGADSYKAGVLAQGAAWCGVGVLRDVSGNDRYSVGLAGQGYAGVQGVGALLDERGHDGYQAGGREPDFERNDDRFVSLAQGFAIGLRPFAGGGTGVLVDRAGNDVYVADVYGQGVSYWYSVGMLLDAGGNDRYTIHQYGQGTGIHLSAGLLADLGGDDVYTGAILAQGSAHDYAVGLLIEKDGRDVYVGRQHAQGRSLNNALAMLLEGGGDDSYFAYPCDECQGIGNDGDKREYGSLALLLDLGGEDFYTCGGRNGEAVERPDYGIIYDVNDEEASP